MVTGVTNSFMEVSAKFLELLLAAAPKLKHIGILLDSTLHASFRATHMETVQRASTQLSVEARIAEIGKREEIEPALARLAKEGAQGLIVLPGTGWFNDERTRILETALTQRWPVIGGPLQWAEQGALLSYGPELPAIYRRAAWYVDRILKGAKPGDLPIEQPTKFNLVVNMRTAKVLGLTIPQSILVLASRVIE
jgi:putative ABC transport system substrate-binding protein